jgi:hypothetical protein
MGRMDKHDARTTIQEEAMMGALQLDQMTWPEVKRAQEAGRDTRVIALEAPKIALVALG